MTEVHATLSTHDQEFLAEAAAYLENPRLLMRMANLVGKPAEVVLGRLPQSAQESIGEATHAALKIALQGALRTLPKTNGEVLKNDPQAAAKGERLRRWERNLHTTVAATTGAVGGFFGLAGMTVELPATITVMLRSIATIAREEGFALDDPHTRLQCLAVLSLGAEPLRSMESAYLTSRLGMTLAIRDAALFLTQHTAGEVGQALSRGTAPVLVRLLNSIAAKFQIVVSQKMAAQSIPVAGAALGALINAAFTDHFNRVARYHFGIVRLEQRCGREVVQTAYEQAAQGQRKLSDKVREKV